MIITKTIEWDMGHRVPNHKSKCRNLHWHRYKALISLHGDIVMEKGVSDEWMVIDFSDIKEISKTWIDDHLDHGYMFQTWDEIGMLAFELGQKTIEVPFVPTAENIAKFLFDRLDPLFEDVYKTDLKLFSIELWETPNGKVIYSPYIN